ncbi:Protein SMAX1-LIKE 7 [Camellia lanceoleosa]|uniref:Protein SMAX1-LIKE 7 n=1 Tax=Camellia lanceoleosa TaxID=1840588 RepID=A0ACC0HS95_9ERIC|nr:Protein SMAX1-LIKE 7 [Camellia lanceoleosa]
MPTPVSTARQCLTDEAARALDAAVSVARRRSHAQTTSLHAVSALLSPPSSTLRDACSRAPSSVYSPRLQFRALELSVGVSLDRIPTSKADDDDPPVANSLMAAIKRSQANQRRHPYTFHLYQQVQNQSQSSVSCVKVEMKHFILSILDDPIVSRVFGESGFRSSDIKLAILRPPPISRSRCPPLFLCNLADSDSDSNLNRRGFNFPFMGFSGFENGDGNCRRIGEVLANKKGKKNPLLIGVCANDALGSFTECVQRGKIGVLPSEIDGLSLICVEKEIYEFLAKGGSEEIMGLKFKEVCDSMEHCSQPGIVINIGELKVLIADGNSVDNVNYVVSQLSGLLEAHGEKLWLIGGVENYETYMKILAQFPSVEKDWDLHLLPITSSNPSSGGLYSKPSLMGSFVPLGGFFSTPSEFKNLVSSTNQPTRCDLCNEKYEQEASVILKGGSTTSIADQYSASLSSWLQMTECDANKRVDVIEAKDDETVLNAKLTGLQRKWNDICQRLHPTRPFRPDISQSRFQSQHVEGFHFLVDRKESSSKNSSSNETESSNLISSTLIDLRKVSPLKQKTVSPVASEVENADFQPTILIEASKSHQPNCTSPSSATYLTTDLGLGTLYAVSGQEPGKLKFEHHKSRLHFSGSTTAEFDGVSENTSNHIASPSSCSGPELERQVNPKDFKSLWRALTEKVGRQSEAICTISQTISRCRTGHGRLRGSNHKGDIWLSFVGHDKVGKKRIAAALAEIMFGRRESLISVDLSSVDGISCSNSIFNCQDLSSYDVKFRGKTVIDYIAEELSRKPRSVVLLENVDKADLPAQDSLSRAIRTGKFPDWRGREISINNAIFVITSNTTKVTRESISGKEHVEFSEDRVLGAKGWQMQILVGCVGDATRTNGMSVSVMSRKENSKPISRNKRKLLDMNDSSEMPKHAHKASKLSLDLNLPVEESEENNYGNCDGDSNLGNLEVWLEDFFGQVDETVVFEPLDFNALADKVLMEIDRSFKKTVGSEALLEIDEEAMVGILAAGWLSDNKSSGDGIERVLSRSFAEAQQRYCLTTQSILKLVACEGLFVEEQAPGVCLPARITLN